MNRFRCKLVQEVHGARPWNGQLWGSGGQNSRSPEAEYRFGGVAEASFLTPLGRASFLVTNIAFSLEACDCDCQVTYGIKREALVEISESLVRHAFDVFLCLLLHTVLSMWCLCRFECRLLKCPRVIARVRRWRTLATRSPTSRTFNGWRTGSVFTSPWWQCRRSATAISSARPFSAASLWSSSSWERWSVTAKTIDCRRIFIIFGYRLQFCAAYSVTAAEHYCNKNTRRAQTPLRPKSDPGFISGLIRINSVGSGSECRIAPIMYWIHSLVGASHIDRHRKIRPVTVWEILINLIKSPIPQWWEKWKSDPESVSGSGSPPKVNHF